LTVLANSKRGALVGREQPRVFTPPLRPLTPETSLGFDVIFFTENILRQPLMPWQKWLLIHAMELRLDGKFRFRTVVIIVARQNGKTHVMRPRALWQMYLRRSKILGAAQNLMMSVDTWKSALQMIQDNPIARSEYKRHSTMPGGQEFELKNGSLYKVVAGNSKAPRGKYGIDLLLFDELREQKDYEAWNALEATTSAAENPQTFCMSNAGTAESVVLNAFQDRAHIAIQNGDTEDTSVGFFEWSAPAGVELTDPDAWEMANPALGYTIDERVLAGALDTSTPDGFRTERLCIRVTSLVGAIDMSAWSDCFDGQGNMNSVKGRLAACLDVSLTNHHASLVVAGTLPDGRVRIETVAAWYGPHCTDEVRATLPGLLARIKPKAFGWFPNGPAASIAADLNMQRNVIPIKPNEITQACMGFAEQVSARRLLHNGDSMLAMHARNAEKRMTPEGAWRFDRRLDSETEVDIDGVYAAAGAVHLARTAISLGKPRLVIV
jgi:hypothetical protein